MPSFVPKIFGLAACAVAFAQPSAADWTRTWVFQWNEPAFYYGGETGVDQPGTDCPAGNNPDADWKLVLIEAGYSEQEAIWLEDPTHPWQVNSQGNPQLGFRGKDKANVWKDPTTAKEKPFVGVSGKISWGLNLDGDESTGFISPDGKIKGVDNQFYKALGCLKYFRGPPRTSYNAEVSANGSLSSGSAIVFVASGKGDDPMNDPEVRFGIYASPDGIVKDATGKVTPGFTFRIQPSATLDAVFDAQTVNGVIQSTRPMERVVLRDPTYAGATEFLKAQITFRMHPDGRLVGEVGGYRPWEPLIKRLVQTGARRMELVSGAELDQMWYTLRRHADYSPTGPEGEKTHISYAIQYDAVPAFVMTPDGKSQVSSVERYSVQPRPGEINSPNGRANDVVDGMKPLRGGSFPFGPDVKIPPPASLQVASSQR